MFELGELHKDEKLKDAVMNFSDSLDIIEQSLDHALMAHVKSVQWPLEDQVRLDNYLAYLINTLFWMHVKVQGYDPSMHLIKSELCKVRDTMVLEKKMKDVQTRPQLAIPAVQRFIEHGLHKRFYRKYEDNETVGIRR